MLCSSCSSAHGFERAAGAEARNEALSGNRLEPPPVTTDSSRDTKSGSAVPVYSRVFLGVSLFM